MQREIWQENEGCGLRDLDGCGGALMREKREREFMALF